MLKPCVLFSLLVCALIAFTRPALAGSQPQEEAPASPSLLERGEMLREAEALDQRAVEAFRSGAWAEAVESLAEVVRMRSAALGERHPYTSGSLSNYGFVLAQTGRLVEAKPVQAEALRLRREVLGERHPATLQSLNNYGFLLFRLGEATAAEPLLEEALRLRREVLGERNGETLQSLNNYAFILLELGRTDEAEQLHKETLRLRREVLGERHPDTIQSINNVASIVDKRGAAQEAEPLYSEALALAQEVLGQRHPHTLQTLHNYASVLEDLDRFVEAHRLFHEALQMRREVLGERHPETLESLNSYAALTYRLGWFDDAEQLFSKALLLRQEVLGRRHPSTLRTLSNNTVFLMNAGRFDQALPLSDELVTAIRERAVQLSDSGVRGDEQTQRELGDRRRIERLHADVLWSNELKAPQAENRLVEEAFEALQFASAGSTSRAVAEAAAARFAAAEGLAALVRERQVLTQEWPIIEAALVETQAGGESMAAARERLRTQLEVIEARIKEIDAQLQSEAPEFFAILKQKAIDLPEVRRVLEADEAILLLVPTSSGTHAMAVSREDISWVRSSMDESMIGRSVEELRFGLEVQAGDAFYPVFDLELAHELYREIINPVEDTLAGKSRVYVVADGALSRLPLGILVTEPPSGDAFTDDPEVLRSTDWLADRYALVQLPSLQSLVYIRSFAGVNHDSGVPSFTGFGAPVLEGASHLRGARSATLDAVDALSLVGERRGSTGFPLMDPDALRKLSALPGTRSELEKVRAALGAPDDALFLADRMTESSIRTAELSRTQILHLATHGLTSEESGEAAEPGLVFTPPSQATPEDDGYLAASEVVMLDLAMARWVILSACNTASPSGKQGETGLSGLAQAFFYAGAQSLLVSHWPVSDEIAPELTTRALMLSQEGMGRAEALQHAMREVRSDPALNAAHPAAWAPFTLVGEGR